MTNTILKGLLHGYTCIEKGGKADSGLSNKEALGAWLSMINDFNRNNYYDRLFELSNIKNKVCLEVGFQTGLLSLMALKHGASSIVAYEMHDGNYYFGKHIINELGLQDKITLIHDYFTADKLSQHPEVEVIFHELIGGSNIWNEGLSKVYSQDMILPKIDFIPGNIGVDFYYCTVNETFIDLISREMDSTNMYLMDFFAPGIDIDVEFIKIVNQLISGETKHDIKKHILLNGVLEIHPVLQKSLIDGQPVEMFNDYNEEIEEIYFDGQHTFLKNFPKKRICGNYDINFKKNILSISDKNGLNNEKKLWPLNSDLITTEIEINDPYVAIVPRSYLMLPDNSKHYIDNFWCFGPFNPAYVIVHNKNNLKVTHHMFTGELEFHIN